MTNPDTRVLVVDDTRFSATLVARTLGQAGYRDRNPLEALVDAGLKALGV